MRKRTMFAGGSRLLFKRAAAHRKRPTHCEDALWTILSQKPLGHKFRRQHVYGIYILDFYCHSLKLAIEVDGPIHDREDVARNDARRQQALENLGIRFLRFTNDEIKNGFDAVRAGIELFILSSKP